MQESVSGCLSPRALRCKHKIRREDEHGCKYGRFERCVEYQSLYDLREHFTTLRFFAVGEELVSQ